MGKKERFAFYLTPEKKAILERRYREDGSRSMTAFIERAVDFYLDYLSANDAGLFLPTSIKSYLDGRLGQLEERITSTQNGSITSVQAIYVPADDLTDPAPATIFSHLDATTVLSRKVVESGIYPAVDPLESSSSHPLSGRSIMKRQSACLQRCSTIRSCRMSSPFWAWMSLRMRINALCSAQGS